MVHETRTMKWISTCSASEAPMKRFIKLILMLIFLLTIIPATAESSNRWYEHSRDRWDFVAGGPMIGGAQLQLFTIHFRHVRITLIDGTTTFDILNPGFAAFAGSTVGVGGHHGSGHRSSHWFIFGAQYGFLYGGELFRMVTRTYHGLFLPIGYEFRHRLSAGDAKVWGFRVYFTLSPVGIEDVEGCDCTICLVCDEEDRDVPPMSAGAGFFFGF